MHGSAYLQLPDLLFILLKHINEEGLAFQLAAFAAQRNAGQALFLQPYCLLQRALRETESSTSFIKFVHLGWGGYLSHRHNN